MTSSTQSPEIMLTSLQRYETSWQYLFTKESALRTKLPIESSELDVHGNLMIFQHEDSKVLQTATIAGENDTHRPVCTFTSLKTLPGGLKDISATYPWIKFALEYYVSIRYYSAVLQEYNPSCQVTFYPYTRLFFTLGESLADKRLIDILFDRAVARLAPFEISTTFNPTIKAEAKAAQEAYKRKLLAKLPYRYQFGDPYLNDDEVAQKVQAKAAKVIRIPGKEIQWQGMDHVFD